MDPLCWTAEIKIKRIITKGSKALNSIAYTSRYLRSGKEYHKSCLFLKKDLSITWPPVYSVRAIAQFYKHTQAYKKCN